MLIPDPGSEIFHPGSRIQGREDPGSGSGNDDFKYFYTGIVTKLWER